MSLSSVYKRRLSEKLSGWGKILLTLHYSIIAKIEDVIEMRGGRERKQRDR